VAAAARDLDRLGARAVVTLLAQRERQSVAAVEGAAPRIAQIAKAVARAILGGGRLVYVGAGTSGRLGVLDASECPPTFGTRPSQVLGVIAGGRRALTRSVEGAEDDAAAGATVMARLGIGRLDVVVGVAASGLTPFVHGALAAARARGAKTALVTCAGSAARRAGARVDWLVDLAVGPEVLAGSTRLGAGTAQKLTLNAISTTAMVLAGKTYGPHMVDVRVRSKKLAARARRLVEALTPRRGAEAEALLTAAGGEVKIAVVMDRLGLSRGAARRALAAAQGSLRAVIDAPRRGRRRPAPRRSR
jgi:N-acetylmuramic acid 6-phosphate etherase